MRSSNIYYEHHFGEKIPNVLKCSLDKEFSPMVNGLTSAIGLAYYLGFSKVILLGCDYLFENPENGHFFEYGEPRNFIYKEKKEILDFYENAKKYLEILILVPTGRSSSVFNYDKISNYTNREDEYKENSEICNEEDLLDIHISGGYEIFNLEDSSSKRNALE